MILAYLGAIMARNPRTTGDWVITNDKDQFFNPRSGRMDDIFVASKHLFHEWHKVCAKMQFGFPEEFGIMKVERVCLEPTFRPDPEPWNEPKIF
jgi:hypothetical protein